MTDKQQTMAAEAYQRATGGASMANYAPIFEGFMARGIPAAEIEPRVNVLTYHAWRAKGRQVRKGEHGVKVSTWVPITGTDDETGERKTVGRRAKTAVVFHISQTQEAAQ